MIDRTKGSPMRVSTEGTAGPFIRLSLDQVDEVKRVLDEHGVSYWVGDNAISLNGGPYIAVINLGRRGDAQAVQRILDEVP